MEVDTKFPIFGSRAMKPKERKSRIGGIHADAQTIIDGLQPCCLGKNYARDPLWWLYVLSNRDKHRLLNLTQLASAVQEGIIDGGNVVIEHLNISSGIMEKRTTVVDYRIRSLSNQEVNVKFRVAVDVAFGKGEPLEGRTPVQCLDAIGRHITKKVLPPLKPYL
jgi:hypothetical protein